MRGWALLLAVTVAVGGAEQPAWARDGARAARKYYRAGKRHYRAGRYERAVEYFRKAHRARQEPAFLFNIAQSLRLAGDCSGSLATYQRFLTEAPDARVAPEVRAQVAKLRLECPEASDAPPAAVPPAPPPAPVSEAPASPRKTPPPASPSETVPESSLAPAPGPGPASGLYFGPGIGLAILGTGTEGSGTTQPFVQLEGGYQAHPARGFGWGLGTRLALSPVPQAVDASAWFGRWTADGAAGYALSPSLFVGASVGLGFAALLGEPVAFRPAGSPPGGAIVVPHLRCGLGLGWNAGPVMLDFRPVALGYSPRSDSMGPHIQRLLSFEPSATLRWVL